MLVMTLELSVGGGGGGGGVEPYYISASRSFRFGWLGISVIKLVVVTAFL